MYIRRLTTPIIAHRMYMPVYPVDGSITPRTIGPSPDPKSTIAAKVDVATPYLCAGVSFITMVWQMEYTMEIPYQMTNPEARNRISERVVPNTSIPTMKATYPGNMTMSGPFLSKIFPVVSLDTSVPIEIIT